MTDFIAASKRLIRSAQDAAGGLQRVSAVPEVPGRARRPRAPRRRTAWQSINHIAS